MTFSFLFSLQNHLCHLRHAVQSENAGPPWLKIIWSFKTETQSIKQRARTSQRQAGPRGTACPTPVTSALHLFLQVAQWQELPWREVHRFYRFLGLSPEEFSRKGWAEPWNLFLTGISGDSYCQASWGTCKALCMLAFLEALLRAWHCVLAGDGSRGGDAAGMGAIECMPQAAFPSLDLAPSDTSAPRNGAPLFPQVKTAWIFQHCTIYSEKVFQEGVGVRPQDSNLEYSGEAACPIQHGWSIMSAFTL